MSTQTEATTVEVGTIFDSSWGYDQTNIDFYEVVSISKSGKSAVFQKVGQSLDDTGEGGADYVVPDRTRKLGDPFRRKLHFYRDGVGFPPESYSWASLWEGSARYQTAVGWGH